MTTHEFQYFNIESLRSACPNIEGFDPSEMPALRAEAKAISDVMLTLANYAESFEASNHWRKAGRVDLALKIEAHAQDIYDTLPQWAKW